MSPQLRADILASKDVNLALLPIPGFKSQEVPNQRHLVVDGDVIPLKGLKDSSLNKKWLFRNSSRLSLCIKISFVRSTPTDRANLTNFSTELLRWPISTQVLASMIIMCNSVLSLPHGSRGCQDRLVHTRQHSVLQPLYSSTYYYQTVFVWYQKCLHWTWQRRPLHNRK